MSFLADVLTEDAFYGNLTLGLTKLLEHSAGVENVQLERKQPCERMQLSSWEQRHCCVLPNDLRQFYLSTDGFKLTWSYKYAGDVIPIGNLKINGISELRRLAGVKAQGDADCPTLLDVEVGAVEMNRPHFGVKCKIFEIDACQGNGRVCLVYLDKLEADIDRRDTPKIWLLDRSFEWHFLAETFTQYFRMMLVHQGLPQWQFRFTPMGLTPFAEAHKIYLTNFFIELQQMMSLIAPHLLHPELTNSEGSEAPPNHLDPNVFKTSRGKPSKKKEVNKSLKN